MRKKIFFLIFFMVAFAALSVLICEAIRVGPGNLSITGMPIGEKVDLGVPLKIVNDEDEEILFEINPCDPKKVTTRWEMGYDPMPDPSWLQFESKKVVVPPKTTKQVKMYVNIPAEDKYYNQHWVVFFTVTPQVDRLFRPEVAPNYLIETSSNPDIKTPPYGTLGVVPSVVDLMGVKPAGKQKVKFKVFNNDTVEHSYKLYPAVPDGKSQWDIVSSPGFTWVKDLIWLKGFNMTIKVKPNSKKEITQSITVPKEEYYGRGGLEFVLFIVPDSGSANFLRVSLNK